MRFYKKLSPFKIISFDLDDTLYDNGHNIERAEHEFAQFLQQRYALPSYTCDPIFWHKDKLNLIAQHHELEHDVTYARVLALIQSFKRFNIELSQEQSSKLVEHFITLRSRIKVDEEIKYMLQELGQYYDLAAISNGNVCLHCIGLAPYFKYSFRPSYQGFRRKPYPDLFERLCREAKVEAKQILHVGDDHYTDVQGSTFAHCQSAFLRGGIASRLNHNLPQSLPHLELDNIFELRALICLT